MTRSGWKANLPERQKSSFKRGEVNALCKKERKNVPPWLCRIGFGGFQMRIGLGRVLSFDFSSRFTNVDFETIIDFEPSKMPTPITPLLNGPRPRCRLCGT